MDKVSGLRQWLQDNLAPELQRLDERTKAFADRIEEISSHVRTQGDEINSIWQYLRSEVVPQIAALQERMGKLEGSSDGLKREVMADLKLSLMEMREARAERRLPPHPPKDVTQE